MCTCVPWDSLCVSKVRSCCRHSKSSQKDSPFLGTLAGHDTRTAYLNNYDTSSYQTKPPSAPVLTAAHRRNLEVRNISLREGQKQTRLDALSIKLGTSANFSMRSSAHFLVIASLRSNTMPCFTRTLSFRVLLDALAK